MANRHTEPRKPTTAQSNIVDNGDVTPPSTLDPEVDPLSDRSLGAGHGTDALGPSDTSDSGSDIHGAPGLSREAGIRGMDTGTTSDLEESTAGFTAGPDIGDANLDSDTDSTGTGEHATAGRDQINADGRDIGTDRIDSLGGIVNPAVDDDVTDSEEKPPPRHKRH
jgi:hypothetical protein